MLAPLTVRLASDTFYVPSAPDMAHKSVQTLGYRWSLWERLTGDPPIQRIDTDTFAEFRRAGVAEGLSPATLETVITCVLTVLKYAKSAKAISGLPEPGRRLRRPFPDPIQPDVAVLGRLTSRCSAATWPVIPAKKRAALWRAWIVCSYVTALRLEDQMYRLLWSCISSDWITIRASKTTKVHRIPVHPVLARELAVMHKAFPKSDRVFPLTKSTHRVRRSLKQICASAGVPPITPKQIRRTSATQYERAHAGAGALIQGASLRGSVRFYIDAQAVLLKASQSLELPSEWQPASRKSDEQTILSLFRTMTPDSQRLLLATAERLAT